MSLFSRVRVRPYLINKLLAAYSSTSGTSSSVPDSDNGSKEYIDGLVKGKKLVVFIKGTPEQPQCGFSNAVLQILKMHGIQKFDAYNVLENEQLRQGIKKYSNWPTIPQIFMNGEFVGGCDIMIEMHQNGELIKEFKKIDITSALT